MRRLALWLAACGLALALAWHTSLLPDRYRYELQDAVARWRAPNFQLALDSLSDRPQDSVIAELRHVGFDLSCYGNLQRHDKIQPQEDYLCWAPARSAYDGIPARTVAVFFSRGRLSSLRLELPAESYDAVRTLLARSLGSWPRWDHLAPELPWVDQFGRTEIIWRVPHGFVMTSGEPPGSQPLVVGWAHRERQPGEPPIKRILPPRNPPASRPRSPATGGDT